MAATQELTFRLTPFISTYSSSAFAKREPYYVHDLLKQLEMHSLWPLDVGKLSLQLILSCLRAVHVPIMERDTTSSPPATPRHIRSDYYYDSWHVGTRPSSRQSYVSEITYGMAAARKSEQPTEAVLDSIIERVAERCVGLCLDCFKGNDHCRQPHVGSELDGNGSPSTTAQEIWLENPGANW